jgi:hypothetical protein
VDEKEGAPRFDTYAGYFTLGPIKHEIFPHYPMKIPNAPTAPSEAYRSHVEDACASYIRGLIGNPQQGIKRNHLFEGVLLATRFSGPEDLSQADKLDLMAQPTTGPGD